MTCQGFFQYTDPFRSITILTALPTSLALISLIGANDSDFNDPFSEVFFKSITILDGSSSAYELIKATLSRLNTIFKLPDSSSETLLKDTWLDASIGRAKMHKIPSRNFNLFTFIVSFNTGLNIAVLTF